MRRYPLSRGQRVLVCPPSTDAGKTGTLEDYRHNGESWWLVRFDDEDRTRWFPPELLECETKSAERVS